MLNVIHKLIALACALSPVLGVMPAAQAQPAALVVAQNFDRGTGPLSEDVSPRSVVVPNSQMRAFSDMNTAPEPERGQHQKQTSKNSTSLR